MLSKQFYPALFLSALLMAACVPAEEVDDATHETGYQVRSDLLVDHQWLYEHMDDQSIVVLHVGTDASTYEQGHISGARFLELGSIVAEQDGVPNMLADMGTLQEAFESAGVSDDSHVVLYGDQLGLFAARAFFTLEYMGHQNVSMLDGGLEVWQEAGLPATTDVPEVERGSLSIQPRIDRVVTSTWIRDRLDNPDVALIDARPEAQYTGDDPGDLVERPGHIPGAVNIFWQTALESEEHPVLKDPEALLSMYQSAGISEDDQIVAYCRTGVQSSHAYFVARYLGFDPIVYDGSFIDWSMRDELPVAAESQGGR